MINSENLFVRKKSLGQDQNTYIRLCEVDPKYGVTVVLEIPSAWVDKYKKRMNVSFLWRGLLSLFKNKIG